MIGAYPREPSLAGVEGDRSVSPHPNFVTAEGLSHIELELARAQARQDAAEARGDEEAVDRLDDDVRYWTARRATAQVVAPPADASRVHFGSTVTVEAADGARQTWRIVGEDEARPENATLSYVSALAQAAMGRQAGESVAVGDATFRIVSIA